MRSLFLFAIFVAGVAGAAEVYRWTDPDGQVHFSDRPREGAERIQIQEPSTFQAPATSRRRISAREEASSLPVRYESVEIVSPAQEEVLWNIEGQLEVSMQVQPSLQPGHRLRLSLDGQTLDLAPGSTRAQLSAVSRGVHVLRARVLDDTDQVLGESQPRTFAVQQTSVLNPNNPSAPIVGPR